MLRNNADLRLCSYVELGYLWSRFPGVQPNSLRTYRRALLSERLEQATGIQIVDRGGQCGAS